MTLAALAAFTLALPSTLQPLSASPPLAGGARVEAEAGITHRVSSDERVEVGIDPRGRPFRIAVTQRLTVLDRGDYSYVISAPVKDVEAAPGSQSSPGLRLDSILWAGFGAGRKVLAARAALRVRDAAPSLPLRVTVRDGAVVLENATVARAAAPVAPTAPAPLVRLLATVRRATAGGASPILGGDTIVAHARPASVDVAVEAPLHVVGLVGRTRVDVVLGDTHPLRVAVRSNGRISLAVTPVPPRAALTAGPLLRRTVTALQRIARVRQYRQFLANPDPRGASRAVYVYRSAARPRAAPPFVDASRRSWTLAWLLAGAAAVVAAVFVWARS